MGNVKKNILNILSDGKYESEIMDFVPAEEEFSISEDRIRHMHGVAELMYRFADNFHCRNLSKDEIYMLGLNHDIGYLNGKYAHETNGAILFSNRVIRHCIQWHDSSPEEYLKIFSREDLPRELIMLWWADMMVESAGENAGKVVGFRKRLENISERYGRNSDIYRKCKEKVDWLIGYFSEDFI